MAKFAPPTNRAPSLPSAQGTSLHVPMLVLAAVPPWWAGAGDSWGYWSGWEVTWWKAGERWEHVWRGEHEGLCWM